MSFPKFVNMTKNPHPFIFMYENRPYKYVFLHAFFLICPPCPFQNLSNDQKPHPFIFRYENRPYKYVFLHAFFLICPPCHFQNLSIWPKTHPCFPSLHVFALLNDVRAYIAWSWKTTLITFFSRMISNFKYKCLPPPPRVTQVGSQNVLTLTVGLCNSIGTVAKPTTFIFNYGWW